MSLFIKEKNKTVPEALYELSGRFSLYFKRLAGFECGMVDSVIMMGLPERIFYTIFPCFYVQDMDIHFINSRENVLAFIFAGRNFLGGQCNDIIKFQWKIYFLCLIIIEDKC